MASFSEDPSLSALNTILEKISVLQDELKAATNAVSNQVAPQAEDDEEEESKASKKIRKEYDHLIKEISLLRKSVPEGLPEAEEFQYFLAVAELQKHIDDLKVHASLSERNLHFVQEQVQMTQNLILDEEKLNALRKEMEISAATAKDQAKEPRSAQDNELEQKLRSTKLVFKELKQFIGELLENQFRKDHTSGEQNLLGQLIQNLWTAFSPESPEKYLKMSHLEYDVSPKDVAWLIEYGIVERNPSDQDQIRLINFTE